MCVSVVHTVMNRARLAEWVGICVYKLYTLTKDARKKFGEKLFRAGTMNILYLCKYYDCTCAWRKRERCFEKMAADKHN